jgi:large subunit ribosomal protein L21
LRIEILAYSRCRMCGIRLCCMISGPEVQENDMYAVIRTGSKQYRVSPGDVITVEKLDLPEGKKCSFEDVVMFHDGDKVVSSPKELASVRVSGKVVGQGKSDKVIVFKYKPKKGYRKKRGHRQELTRVEIEDIIVRKTAKRQKTPTPVKAESRADETEVEKKSEESDVE